MLAVLCVWSHVQMCGVNQLCTEGSHGVPPEMGELRVSTKVSLPATKLWVQTHTWGHGNALYF